MPFDGCGNRLFIAGNTRDQCGTRDVADVELMDPPVREIIGRAGLVPPQPMRYFTGAVGVGVTRLAGGQKFEEAARKEMTMSVANTHREKPIIIGLVSDTHGLVRDTLFAALAGASQILHAGDVGGRDVIHALETIAPVLAVYGNVDPLDGLLPQEVALEAGGLSIHVSHGHELGSPTPARLLSRYSADILVFGHTHRALIEREGKRLVINPGAAGPRRFDLQPSVAILQIADGRADVSIVPLTD